MPAETQKLDSRKRDLLAALVREFVATAEPVGSVKLVEKYGFDISSATIRNEMVELERMGLIEQPHTSAGRIPTEAGFRAFVELALKDHEAGRGQTLRRRLKASEMPDDREEAVKSVAKYVAECAREAVVVAFGPRHVYYTGLSHLFNQPEFHEFGRVVRFSELIDRLDEVIEAAFPKVAPEVSVWIGEENPFGNLCGTVIANCDVGEGATGAIGVLGPVRMDYERSVALVGMAQEALKEAFVR